MTWEPFVVVNVDFVYIKRDFQVLGFVIKWNQKKINLEKTTWTLLILEKKWEKSLVAFVFMMKQKHGTVVQWNQVRLKSE